MTAESAQVLSQDLHGELWPHFTTRKIDRLISLRV